MVYVFLIKNKKAFKISSNSISGNDKLYVSSLIKDQNNNIWVAIPKYGLYLLDYNEKN